MFFKEIIYQLNLQTISTATGGIGAIRYCSSKDLGNYCDYVQNKGDQMEYRSCINTCDTDGCNGSEALNKISPFIMSLIVAVAKIIFK